MKKKLLCVSMCVAMAASALVGCGSSDSEETTKAAAQGGETKEEGGADATGGKVYYLNFKPESEEAWQKVAKAYKEATGVEVKVVTAASDTYESTLKSEMAKSEAPTLFQINGPVGYATWAEYCKDLSGTDFASWVTDQSMLVTGEDGGVYGVPYCVEAYGLIVNKTIFAKYFELADRADTGCDSLDDINTFDKLKKVADDMQKNKDALGIDGVFSSAGMDSSSDWRFKTHLLNVAISAEFAADGVDDKDEIDFKYADNFKQMWDLYTTDSTCDTTLLAQKTGPESATEFATGKAAIYQNGVWAWNDIKKGDVKEEDIAYLPIYMGLDGEENQGLCVGTENFMCINSEASEADQAATLAFVEWVFGDDAGKDMVANDLGFLTMFSTFTSDQTPSDPLMKAAAAWNSDSSKKTVAWVGMNHFPSEEFKNVFGSDILEYAMGNTDWSDVVDNTKTTWAEEKEASK